MTNSPTDDDVIEEAVNDIKETVPLATDETKKQDGGDDTPEVKDTGSGALDGGYGWVIVFACFWIQFLFQMPMVYGILYVDLLEVFGRSNADTAWPGSISIGLALLLDPFASMLCIKIGHRLTCMLGGVITAVGMFTSAFVNDVYVLTFTYGVLGGVGMAFSFIPGVVMVGFYFDKRKSLANGLAVTGVGVAGMVCPPLATYLKETYTWRGCLMIMAGISLNTCVFGALLRPVSKGKHAAQAQKETKIFELSLLKDWKLIIFIFIEILWNIGCLAWVTLIVDHGIMEGFTINAASLLSTSDGAGGVVGKMGVALLSGFKCCNRLLLYALAVGMSSIPMILVSVETSYAALMIYTAIAGLCFGIQLSLLPVLVVELFGVHRLTSAYGYIMLGDGIGCLVGPPLGGLIFDVTKSYAMSFLFGGLCCVLSAILVLVIVIANKCAGDKKMEEIELDEKKEEEHVMTRDASTSGAFLGSTTSSLQFHPGHH